VLAEETGHAGAVEGLEIRCRKLAPCSAKVSSTRSKGEPVTKRRSGSVDGLLSDDEIRERHRKDLAKAEEVLRELRDGKADTTGIAGEELRGFLREHG
jgi:hypothetical protein